MLGGEPLPIWPHRGQRDHDSFDMWEIFTRQMKCGLVSHIISAYSFCMIDERKAGRASPDAGILQPALARALRPLVRLAIRAGIPFPALTDLLREVYVHVADKEFVLPGKEQTDSRVSILTGVHRKEVHRLREAGAPISSVPGVVSRGSRILAQWMGAPEFLDETGRPRPLARGADDGNGPTFEDLVESVTKDVRPRSVLDEWLAQGLVSIDSNQMVRLDVTAFVPSRDAESLAYYFGRNLHDHLAAAVENLDGRKPAFLERAVHYAQLTEEQAAALEGRARELALEALQEANRSAIAMTTTGQARASDNTLTSEKQEWRWTFGVYVYRENPDQKK